MSSRDAKLPELFRKYLEESELEEEEEGSIFSLGFSMPGTPKGLMGGEDYVPWAEVRADS